VDQQAESCGMTAPSTRAAYLRTLREGTTRRRLELVRLLRENSDITNIELAKLLNVSRNTITADRLAMMEQAMSETKSEMQQYRENQLARIADKWDEIESDETMTGAEKHLAWSRWMKLEMDLRGTAAPSKSIVGHVNGPQLDTLYLEIRQELLDLGDEAKQDALLLMREFAKSRKKPVVVDAMPLQPVERRLTDGGILRTSD
jgi:DNA-binding CsgD family transcriptional regulator